MRWLIGVSLPIMFVLYVESDRIIGTIYGGAYHEAMWMQKYLVFTVICAFVHNLAAYLMMSQGKERLLLFIYVAGLALNLALCAVLIPADPLLGACLAMVVTKAAVAAATTIYCHVKMRIVGLRALLPIGLALTAGTALYLVSGLFGRARGLRGPGPGALRVPGQEMAGRSGRGGRKRSENSRAAFFSRKLTLPNDRNILTVTS